jgi:hypothetical protein
MKMAQAKTSTAEKENDTKNDNARSTSAQQPSGNADNKSKESARQDTKPASNSDAKESKPADNKKPTQDRQPINDNEGKKGTTSTKRRTKSTNKPAVKKNMATKKTSRKTKAKSSSSRKSSPAKRKTSSGAKAAIRSANAQTRKMTEEATQTTQRVVRMHADNMKNIMSKGARESRDTQGKLLEMSRESMAQFAKGSEKATESINEAIAQGRSTMEACIECTNLTSDMAKSFTNEMFRYTNEAFSENIEISKDIFTCRTINDVLELQNKMMRNNVDNFFNESLRLTEMFFDYASEASEPLNERIAEATERFSKSVAA